MVWARRFWLRLQTLLRRNRGAKQLDDEIQFHLEQQIAENIAAGMSREEARYAAMRAFGNPTFLKEETRDTWGWIWLEQICQDIRYGLRTLKKNPGFTAAAILTLSFGIGMNTAVFSVVNAVLLHPLAYPNADSLVWLSDHGDWGDNYVSPAGYLLWKNSANSFDRMVAYGDLDLALVTGGEATEERVASITSGFWSLTSAQAALGRLFTPGESNTIVLSHALFERRFGNDPAVIGKTVTLNGHSFAITGVLPQNFQFLFPQQSIDERREIDAYVPLPSAILGYWSVTMPQYEGITHNVGPTPWALCVVGRLRPNVPFERAESEMQAIYARVKEEHYPSWQQDLRLRIAPLKDKIVGNSRAALIVIFGAVCFVLMIASANIANLLLARVSTRQKEMAIRAAIGAGRGRLIRQLMAESVLLALFGGLAGLAVARCALTVMVRLGSEVIPRVGQANIDTRVLLFTLTVSFITGFLFGLGPALSLLGSDLHIVLKNQSGKVALAARRVSLRGSLLATELALAIILLTGAGLMLKSFWRMTTYPQGFDPEKILVMRIPLYGERYGTLLQQDAYIGELLRRIDAIPGVEATGVQRGTLSAAVKVQGASALPGKEPYASVQGVSVRFLRAMGVPLMQGEWPRKGSLDTFVVNESFVRQILGQSDPIGKHLSGPVMNGTIVGVVADFKTWQLDAEPSPEVYIPYLLLPAGRSARVMVRIHGDPRLVASIVRELAARTDPAQPVYELQTLDHALSNSIAPRRFNLFVLGTFATMALAMALVGVYGVMAYLVSQRTHEIGVRMALGGRACDVLTLVTGQALRTCGIGVAIGICASLILTRAMQSLLFGVSASDPMTLVAVVLLLILVVLLASYIPARRATRVDPMVALRYE